VSATRTTQQFATGSGDPAGASALRALTTAKVNV
jgi:hypothetical protein